MCLCLHTLVVIRLPALTVTLTYALIQMVKKIAGKSDKARMITKARVTELIMSGGACLMNVWISARRRVRVFAHWCHLVVRRRHHRHSDGAVPVPRVRLQAGDVQRQLDGGAEFAILVPDPIASTQDTSRGALSQGRHEDRQE